MLYGNLIFIKKTGGDGSKFPVTEKNIKIGRSENCLIRIYNPQVAPEHCQLIIDYNGQAKLRNLFTPTILNGKPLGQGDVTLCHGDVFKLGERLARWEYLPTSKYFRQLLSPAGRLVAVVNPQRRSDDVPGTSATQVLANKSTPIGNKRKISEKFAAENSSAAKQRRTIGSDASLKPKVELSKLLLGRHSMKSGKVIIKTPIIKQRKSVAGIISSKLPKSKASEISRKSTLPSWKVNIDSQSSKKSPPKKTPQKKSLKSEVRTPSKSTPIKVKTPKRLKDVKTGDKTALKTIMESPGKPEESTRSTRSFSKSPPAKVLSTPKGKPPISSVRLIQSEKKLKTKPNKGVRKMSLVLKRVDGNEKVSVEKELSVSGRQSKKNSSNENEAEVEVSSQANNSALISTPEQTQGKSVTPMKTPRKSVVNSKKSSVKKSAKDIIETPPLIDFSDDSLVDTKRTSRESVKSSRKSVRQSSPCSVDLFQTPLKSSGKIETPLGKSTGKKPRSAAASPISSSGSAKSGKVASSRKSVSGAKEKASPKGVRRKLSPLISSAERAAKKLKTSSPKKPDKNKRAALLVLGKANRKQLLSQNVKVLLKQKIVKKAIKQSVILPARKNEKAKSAVRKIKKDPKTKKSTKTSKPKISTSTRISAVKEYPIESISINESEKRKSSERSSLSRSKISSPVPAVKSPSSNATVKSPPKSNKKRESVLSSESTNETNLPFVTFDKGSESYVMNSSRRSSKRLSSKNDTERPDFVELSPTALGLIPKRVEVFKTPKERRRNSSSLVTPKNIRTSGIIKSASKSKMSNRKSVSFLPSDLPLSSTPHTPNVNDKTDFDFESFQTPDITMDVFISPLDKSTANDESSKSDKRRSNLSSKKVVRKLLQTPQKEPPAKSPKLSEENEGPKNSESGVGKARKSPKNDLSDVRGVRRLMKTPKQVKSPKNDLSDVKGVKRLMQTPKKQKSPKNELVDLRGVKKLMQSPKIQKSPKNDLSDVKGVKKLMQTPKIQKSPKNELIDLWGVKKLLQSPKVQKSPKNDLSDVKGVKKLMQTPKMQKSPKNELIDLKGVKKLLGSPKIQKSPKNDLTDVIGVKQLLKTPKVQKSPKNDLTEVEGVAELFASPEVKKAKKTSKGPKNDLSDVTGVRELFARHKPISDYSVNLSGVAELFETFISEEEKGVKSTDAKDTKTVRGRGRKLDAEKEEKVATPRGRPRKDSSVEVQTRSTRSRKQVGFAVEEKPTEATKTTRGKKAEPVRKTRTKKEEIEKEEAPKNLRKRKGEEVEASPPKLRRKATASKTEPKESKTVAKSRSKTKEKPEAKSSKKTTAKTKTPAKVSKVQKKTTKSGVETQKVQKSRSQSKSPKSRSKVSPRKTRSVKAKSSTETQSSAAKRKK